MLKIYIGSTIKLKVNSVIFCYKGNDPTINIVNHYGSNLVKIRNRIGYAKLFKAKYGFRVTKLK